MALCGLGHSHYSLKNALTPSLTPATVSAVRRYQQTAGEVARGPQWPSGVLSHAGPQSGEGWAPHLAQSSLESPQRGPQHPQAAAGPGHHPLPERAPPAGWDRSRASREAGLPPWPSARPHGHHPDSLCASLHVLCLKPQTGARTRVVADLGGQYQRLSHKAPWHRGEVRAPSSKDEPALPVSALGAGTHLCRQT